MLILALETSTMVSSVAVATEEKLLAEITVQTRLTHSETLMPHIQEVLRLADVQKEDLDAVAVSIGPGSFTGLRIGLAAAKGMAYALHIPITGVPTLAALASRFPVPGAYLAPLMDAQKGHAYMAMFSWQADELHTEQDIEILSLDEVLEHCAAKKAPVVLAGDIARKKLAPRTDMPDNVSVAPPALVMPRAAEVAFLGLRQLAAGKAGNVMDMEPVYIRRSEAEVLWEARHGKTVS